MARGNGGADKGASAQHAEHKDGARRGQNSPQNVATPARGGRSRAERGDGGRGSGGALEDVMRRKGVDEAWNTLEEMQRKGVTSDKYTISRMLMKTVGDGRTRLSPSRVYRAIALVEKFVDTQPKDVDEVLFNALLDTCGRLKDLGRLETTVQRMRELKVTPSPVTLGILVKTYGQAGDLQKVLHVWDEMETQRGLANAVTYGCMIDACVKCGNLAKAVEVFEGMRQEGKHKNTILYTTLIKGHGLEKNLDRALELFREMPKEGVPYNTITYNSIIDACIKCGSLATGEGLLREMTAPESPLAPDLITFSTLLKGYCQVGDMDKALQVGEAIKARGLRCDELVYNTLMDGCVKANDVTAGVGLFEEMVAQGMRPSAITHSILARLYQRAGYEDDAAEAVAQLYQHHGIDRPGGGDRSKASIKKTNPRSPNSRGGDMTPLASPCTGPAGFWGDLSHMSGYEPSEPSAPPTPLSSALTGQVHGAAAYMQLDAMGNPLQLPMAAMGGHAQFSNSCTPLGSPIMSSLASSPCVSPYAADMHMATNPMTAMAMGQHTPVGSASPGLPPWPLPCSPFPGLSSPMAGSAPHPGMIQATTPMQTISAGPPPAGPPPMGMTMNDASLSQAAMLNMAASGATMPGTMMAPMVGTSMASMSDTMPAMAGTTAGATMAHMPCPQMQVPVWSDQQLQEQAYAQGQAQAYFENWTQFPPAAMAPPQAPTMSQVLPTAMPPTAMPMP